MRIAAVFVYRHNRSVRAYQILPPKLLQNPLLDFELVRPAFADATANFLERSGGDLIEGIAGGEVGFNLFFAQSGFEKGDQITGAHNILSQPTYQFQCSAVDQRYRKNAVVR